jgi:hypothetical protein
MKYRVQVPAPSSARYVQRNLYLHVSGGFTGHGDCQQLDPAPGVLEFEVPDDIPPEIDQHALDGQSFTLELVESNSTGSRQNRIPLVPELARWPQASGVTGPGAVSREG